MWFLYLLSWVATFVQVCLVTLALGKLLDLRTQLCLLIILSGDIAENPGPYQPKYPCGLCTKAAKWGQSAIECDNCQNWFHRECLGMSETIYDILAQHDSYSYGSAAHAVCHILNNILLVTLALTCQIVLTHSLI